MSPHTICRSLDGMLDINVETQSLISTGSVVSDNVTEAEGALSHMTSKRRLPISKTTKEDNH